MWAFSRRLLPQNKLISRNLLRRNDAIVGWFNSKPCFARGKQDDSKDETYRISRLFTPKPVRGGFDTVSAAELTGNIDKSDVLKVLNKFSQKTTNRALCAEYGLDGKHKCYTF